MLGLMVYILLPRRAEICFDSCLASSSVAGAVVEAVGRDLPPNDGREKRSMRTKNINYKQTLQSYSSRMCSLFGLTGLASAADISRTSTGISETAALDVGRDRNRLRPAP